MSAIVIHKNDIIRMIEIPEEKRVKGTERLSKKLMAKNFLNLRNDVDIQVYKANRSSYYPIKKDLLQDITVTNQ